MLGYTVKDVEEMLSALDIASSYLPQNTSNEETSANLDKVGDLLEGLLSEGHIS